MVKILPNLYSKVVLKHQNKMLFFEAIMIHKKIVANQSTQMLLKAKLTVCEKIDPLIAFSRMVGAKVFSRSLNKTDAFVLDAILQGFGFYVEQPKMLGALTILSIAIRLFKDMHD